MLRSYIYEQGLNARRAYFSIRLAVKTSRPLFYPDSEINLSLQMYSILVEIYHLHLEYILSKIIPLFLPCPEGTDNLQIISTTSSPDMFSS